MVFLGITIAAATSTGSVNGKNIFRWDHVSDIHLMMDRRAFSELRNQTRTAGHGYAKEVFGPAPKSPYSWFRASLSLDGKKIGDVGVRKKGFLGSLSTNRPSLKINTGKFQKGLRVDGINRLVLNNAIEGPSILRQCLAYEIFLEASYPAPRCGYAHVWVNGQDLGLYVLLEHVDKSMLARFFNNPRGALFEGTGSDFRPRWLDTFEPKNNSSKEQVQSLAELSKVMEFPDERLIDSLGKVLDLDAFYTYWALESLVGHEDGYNASANNFFLYLDTGTNLFYFIPWGMDKVMAYADRVVASSPLTVLTGSVISYRLWKIPESRRAYRRKLIQLLKRVWNTKRLVSRLRTMHHLVMGHLLVSQRTRLKYTYPNLVDFVKNRKRVFMRALRKNEPEPEPRLLKPPVWRTPGTPHKQGPR